MLLKRPDDSIESDRSLISQATPFAEEACETVIRRSLELLEARLDIVFFALFAAISQVSVEARLDIVFFALFAAISQVSACYLCA